MSIAKEWFDKAEQTDNKQDKFSYFWKSFNNLYPNGNMYETSKIKNYISHQIQENDAQIILQNNNVHINYLLSQPIINMANPLNDTQRDINSFNLPNQTSLKKLESIFMMIYQIRCNYEHGEKSPSNSRDILLCEHSSPILKNVLSITNHWSQ